MANYKNSATISGFLKDLKYDVNGDFVGIIEQRKFDSENKEYKWYFPFVISHPNDEVKLKIQNAYLKQPITNAGTDLVLKEVFSDNENFLFEITGAISFAKPRNKLMNDLKEILIKFPQMKEEKEFLKVILNDSKVQYIDVIENKVNVKKV